jgi:hypothetical protein
MQQVFESWDVASRPLSPRSRLYPLEPQGIGNAFVESLNGYVVRLAEAHAVSAADLVHRELSRHISPPLVFYSHGMNGLGDSAARWVEVLEMATFRSDLRYLTLLPFKKLFSNRLLLREIRAWCPECYEEMAATGTVYEPLLWYVKPVEACPRHRRLLATTCSGCHQFLRPLYAASRTGRCFRCGMELRWEAGGGAGKTSDPAPTEYQLWLAGAMGQLLAHAPEVRPEILADRIRGVLAAYTEEFAEGNRAAVAEAAQCHCSVFYDWFYGNVRPRADNLLRAWYLLKLPVSFIFSPHGASLLREEKCLPKVKIERAKKLAPRRSPERTRRELQEALNEQPSPSLPEVARRLGYTTTEPLRYADRSLCAQIVINYRRSGCGHRWLSQGAKTICEPSQARKILEEHLRTERRIPPLQRIAGSLGYADDGHIRRKFPELCRALSAKIALQRAERIAAIEPAFERALQANPPPTLREVCQQIGLSAIHVSRAHAPALCGKLKARRREYAEACRAELLDSLKAMLNEVPSPSPKEVYVRLGITKSIATYNFPELCRTIIVRYRQHRHQQSQARQEAVRQEIWATVRRLHAQGLCPSVGRVRSLLKNESLLKWKVIGQAVNDARKALGLIEAYPSSSRARRRPPVSRRE